MYNHQNDEPVCEEFISMRQPGETTHLKSIPTKNHTFLIVHQTMTGKMKSEHIYLKLQPLHA